MKKQNSLKATGVALLSVLFLSVPLFGWSQHSNDPSRGADDRVISQAERMEAVATREAASGNHAAALKLRFDLLAMLEVTLGVDHIAIAKPLNNLADSYSHLKQFDKALPLELRALAIRERYLGSDHPDTAFALLSLAGSYFEMGELGRALPLILRASAIQERVLGAEHSDTLNGLRSLARTYVGLGQYEKALPLQLRVFADIQRRYGPEHPNTAQELGNLAALYFALGQFDRALSSQIRAVEILGKVFPPEHPMTTAALDHLLGIYFRLEQTDKAIPLAIRLLAIREMAFAQWHPDTAVAVFKLAQAYLSVGQGDKALPLAIRGLAILEKVAGSDHRDTAGALLLLAYTYSILGQFDSAIPLRFRALAIFEKTLGPDHPSTGWALDSLADTYSEIGQPDKALPLKIRALAIAEKAFGPDHPNTVNGLQSLGDIYSNLAEIDKALELQNRAVTILERTLGPLHTWTASALNSLGSTYLKAGQPALSVLYFKSSVNSYQGQRERVASLGSDELRSYTSSVANTYRFLAILLTEQGRLSEAQLVLDMLKEDEQFDFIRRSSDADPRRTRIGYNSTEQAWMVRYRQIADRLAALGAEERSLEKQSKLGLSPEQKQRQQALVADLRVARTAFESFLNEIREGFASKGPARAAEIVETSEQAMRELQTMLKELGDDVVLLQYYITEERVGMLLTTPGVQLARSSKIDAKELNRKVFAYQRLLRDPKSNPLPLAQELYRTLVAPVAQDLEQAGAKTVMLSLDGALRYLPFGSLHDGQRYLLHRWNLPIYTSVARNRLRDAVSPQWQAAGLGVTRKWPEFDPLPGVKAEMGSIVKTSAGGVLPGEVYLDEAFTAVRLKNVSQRKFPVLHVASHFRFSPGTEVNSFLLLGDGQQLTLGDIRTQNYRFDNVDLLTLSACDTGLGGGRDERGREIEGFGVIAQQQGAKAVLATLWTVEDQSTAMLMAEMYRRRQGEQLTKIEALRQAQLTLQGSARYAHPFYWAPFILMGNWK